jgi:adenylate kinase family enzyme
VYREKTKPVADYLKQQGLLADIDAHYDIQEVDKILAQVENHLQKLS